jgi:hypothetical protein
MAILLVLCLATDRDDDALDQVIGSAAKSHIKVQPGTWLLDTRETVEAVRDRLDGRKAGRSGQVLVFRLARRWAGRGVDDRTVWLKALERVWTNGKPTRKSI